MSGPTEVWFTDLGKAADELGYLVEEVRATDIILRPKDQPEVTIRIDRGDYFPIVADVMRDLLVPRPERKR